jgi:hypothetical protein
VGDLDATATPSAEEPGDGQALNTVRLIGADGQPLREEGRSRAALRLLMIPEAVARSVAVTRVPSPVAATEDRPMPAPPTATQIGSAHMLGAAGMNAASQPAMIISPAAMTCCGRPGRALARECGVDDDG